MPRFAAVQMESTLLDVEANLSKISALTEEAAASKADAAVFPECALSGYALTADEAAVVAEPIPGPSIERLISLCSSNRILIAVGMIEKGSGERLFNSCALLGPGGILGVYRKTHLPHLGVDRFLSAGGQIAGPFDTEVGRLGVLICYDLRFPEPARILALKGAQVLLIPTAWPQSATLYSDHAARTRSAENSLYLVAANHVGRERDAHYLGRSLITGPDGELLAEAPAEGEVILYADADLARSDEKRRIFVPGEYELDLMGDRKPELYGELVEPD